MADVRDTEHPGQPWGRILAGVSPRARRSALAALYLVWPSSDYTVRAQFQAANQMIPGNLVMIAGHKVGLVKDVAADRRRAGRARAGHRQAVQPAAHRHRGDDPPGLAVGLGQPLRRPADPARRRRRRSPRTALIPATHDALGGRPLPAVPDLRRGDPQGPARRRARRRPAVARGGRRPGRGRLAVPQPVAGGLAAAVRRARLRSQRAGQASSWPTPGWPPTSPSATRTSRPSSTSSPTPPARSRSEEDDSRSVIRRAAPFMRRANSTYVNLRATLDDLDPLVEATGKAAPKLRKVLAELAPFARDARPPVARPGRHRAPARARATTSSSWPKAILPFRDIAVGPVQRNGAERLGGAQGGHRARCERQTPKAAFFRPYVVDFTGWLDDFSHSGIYDANGSASRVATSVNAYAAVGGQLQLVPQELRTALTDDVTARGQNNRCPGSMERPWRGRRLEPLAAVRRRSTATRPSSPRAMKRGSPPSSSCWPRARSRCWPPAPATTRARRAQLLGRDRQRVRPDRGRRRQGRRRPRRPDRGDGARPGDAPRQGQDPHRRATASATCAPTRSARPSRSR